MKKVILLFCSILLCSCATSYQTSVPDNYKKLGKLNISDHWLTENEDLIVNKLTQSIRDNHPNTADWFPKIQIKSVNHNDNDYHAKWEKQLPTSLTHLLSRVSDNLIPNNKNRPTWNVDLTIESAHKEMSTIGKTVYVTYGLSCWSTMMLFCPLKSGYVIDINATVTTDKKESFQISGAGASTALISTPYVYDNDDIANEHESKAFIAAIANITNKLIHHIESVNVSKSQGGYATQHEK